MAVPLKFIAQSAMDAYYRDFKGNTGFFELNDFIFRAAATISGIYQKFYEQKYQELRQERIQKDELVGVDPDMLSVQTLKVESKPGLQTLSDLQFPVMTFLYDKSSVGYQFMMAVDPASAKLERASMDEIWQFDYLPKTDRILWWPQNGKIRFYQNGSCNVKEVELYYIPSVINCDGEVMGDAMIPDGIIDAAVNGTVSTLRQVEAQVVKMTQSNENKIMETEINP